MHIQLHLGDCRAFLLGVHNRHVVWRQLHFGQRLRHPTLDYLPTQQERLSPGSQSVPLGMLKVMRLTEGGHRLVRVIHHRLVFVADYGIGIVFVVDVPEAVQFGKDVHVGGFEKLAVDGEIMAQI